MQAVLQMEQRKQQQQSQNGPAPGPEGQLKFSQDTGALVGPGAHGAGASPCPREKDTEMSTATISSLRFQMMLLSQRRPVTRRM